MEQNASYDGFDPVLWNMSVPQIIVGTALNRYGIPSIAQGIPPILALSWISILFTIDRVFFSNVFSTITYEGHPNIFIVIYFAALYSRAFFFYPGSKKIISPILAFRYWHSWCNFSASDYNSLSSSRSSTLSYMLTKQLNWNSWHAYFRLSINALYDRSPFLFLITNTTY